MHLFKIKSLYSIGGGENLKIYPPGRNFTYSDVIKEIGFGKYQYKIVITIAILYLSMGLFVAMLSFLIPFYKKDIFINEWEVGFLIASQGAGTLVGGILFSYISDIYGRKFSLIAALLTAISSSIAWSFLNTFYPFLVMRFITTLGYGGIAPVGVTYLAEYLPDNQRGFYIVGLDIFRSIGALLIVPASKLSYEEWRVFVLTPVPLYLLCLIVIIMFLPESSRYLLFTNKIEKLIDNLNDMCRENKRKILIRHSIKESEDQNHNLKLKKVRIFDDIIMK